MYMIDDVLLNKQAQIERYIKRIRQEYQDDFELNFTRQDAVVLNIQRACQSCIDMGTHFIRKYKLGIPQYSSDIFDILMENNVIEQELCAKMTSMVGFRNIAVHDYSNLNLSIVKSIIEKHLDDFLIFAKHLANQANNRKQ